MDIDNVSKALELCISNNQQDRESADTYLRDVKSFTGFSQILLKLSLDQSMSKPIQQNAAIQLKNLVHEKWKMPAQKDNYISINVEDKQAIMATIINILPFATNKSNLKLYVQIINKILKEELIWNEFLPHIQNLLSSDNSFNVISGLMAFYQLSKIYEYEMDTKKEIYYNCFSVICQNLEILLDRILGGIMQNMNLFNPDGIDINIVYLILKIFSRTIKMGIPKILSHENRFEKWNNYFTMLIKIQFPENLQILSRIPQNTQELDELLKNILWKIKFICFDIVFTIYQKYGDLPKIGKKDGNLKIFSKTINDNYSKQFLDNFLYSLYQSKDKYYDEDIICIIYQFFQLIVNRKHEILLKQLEPHLELIVKNYLMEHNMYNAYDVELITNTPQEHIYKQYEKGKGFENRRVAISEFISKLCEYHVTDKNNKRAKRARPFYLNLVYDYLISSLEKCDNERQNSNNNLYQLLTKESLLSLLQSIHQPVLDHYQDDVEKIIIKFVGSEIDVNINSHTFLKERATAFIGEYLESYKLNNLDLINHITNNLCANLYNTNDVILSTISAMTVSKIIFVNDEIKALIRPNIGTIFSLILKIMQELDFDAIIECLELLINEYPDEVILFSVEFSKELVNSFFKYVSAADIVDETDTNLVASDDLDESVGSEGGSALSAACWVVKTLNKLLKLCVNNKNYEILEQIVQIIHPVINFGLNSELSSVFMDIIILIHTCLAETKITGIMWGFYPNIINSIIIKNNNVYEEGFAFENIQDIIPLILNFIVKDPEAFLYQTFQNGSKPIDLILEVIPQITELSRKRNNDEYVCGCAMKIIITILETCKYKLDDIIDVFIEFTLNEFKFAQNGYYKIVLMQCISVCYIYNSDLTNKKLEKMEMTNHLLEIWIPLIDTMRFDFELRRTMMAFSSILLIPLENMNNVLKQNIGFMFNKIVELAQKITEISEKRKNKDEAEVSGDDDFEDDGEDDYDGQKSNLNDFIEEDCEDDEDFDENFGENKKFKTLLDQQDEFFYLRDILNYINQNNNYLYNQLFSHLNEQRMNILVTCINQAETRNLENNKLNNIN